MGIQQITLAANTFGDLTKRANDLLTIINLLTDGPSLNANGELRLTHAGTSLNVSGNGIVQNLTVGALNTPAVNTKDVYVDNTIEIQSLEISGVSNITTLLVETANVLGGNCTLSVVNTTLLNAVTGNVQTLTVTSGGILNVQTLIVSTVNVSGGNLNLINLIATTANISVLNVTHLFGTISTSNISLSTLNNCTFSNTSGLTKSNVALSNVDNTSDATKNSAVANLSNKTLMSPLIITGNVSADPTTNVGIASKYYVDSTGSLNTIIVNGAMDIWQRGNSAGILTNSNTAYAADHWKVVNSSNASILVSRLNSVPTFANAGTIFNYSLGIDVNVGVNIYANSEYAYIEHKIEGSDWVHLAQQTMTLSFWFKSSQIGYHTVSFTNGVDRLYLAYFYLSAANTWTYQTITVPPSPSGGTWNYINGTGLIIRWSLLVGNTYRYANTANLFMWLSESNPYYGNRVTQDNLIFTTNDLNTAGYEVALTGVKLEAGSSATPFKFRSYQEELRLCKRYFQKSHRMGESPTKDLPSNTAVEIFIASVGGSGGAGNYSHSIQLNPVMRAAPTIQLFNPKYFGSSMVYDLDAGANCTFTTVNNSSDGRFNIFADGAGSAGNRLAFQWTADAELI